MSAVEANSPGHRLANTIYDSLSEESREQLECLCSVVQSMHLKDVSRPATVLAALEASLAAEETQRAEERVYDLTHGLQAQAATATLLLKSLESTLDDLDRSSAKEAVEKETHLKKAEADAAKVGKYKLQQEQNAARLEAAGFHPELAHSYLHSLRKQQQQQEAELVTTTAALKQYAGLPADMAAARAVLLERMEELQRRKEQLAAGLAGL